MKHQTKRTIHHNFRRNLRNSSTDAERMVWQYLRGRQLAGAKFRRQHTIENYIVDFISFDAMLVIELDGGQHQQQTSDDMQRDALLTACGFKVLRFWNSDVLANIDGVISAIHTELTHRVQIQ